MGDIKSNVEIIGSLIKYIESSETNLGSLLTLSDEIKKSNHPYHESHKHITRVIRLFQEHNMPDSAFTVKNFTKIMNSITNMIAYPISNILTDMDMNLLQDSEQFNVFKYVIFESTFASGANKKTSYLPSGSTYKKLNMIFGLLHDKTSDTNNQAKFLRFSTMKELMVDLIEQNENIKNNTASDTFNTVNSTSVVRDVFNKSKFVRDYILHMKTYFPHTLMNKPQYSKYFDKYQNEENYRIIKSYHEHVYEKRMYKTFEQDGMKLPHACSLFISMPSIYQKHAQLYQSILNDTSDSIRSKINNILRTQKDLKPEQVDAVRNVFGSSTDIVKVLLESLTYTNNPMYVSSNNAKNIMQPGGSTLSEYLNSMELELQYNLCWFWRFRHVYNALNDKTDAKINSEEVNMSVLSEFFTSCVNVSNILKSSYKIKTKSGRQMKSLKSKINQFEKLCSLQKKNIDSYTELNNLHTRFMTKSYAIMRRLLKVSDSQRNNNKNEANVQTLNNGGIHFGNNGFSTIETSRDTLFERPENINNLKNDNPQEIQNDENEQLLEKNSNIDSNVDSNDDSNVDSNIDANNNSVHNPLVNRAETNPTHVTTETNETNNNNNTKGYGVMNPLHEHSGGSSKNPEIITEKDVDFVYKAFKTYAYSQRFNLQSKATIEIKHVSRGHSKFVQVHIKEFLKKLKKMDKMNQRGFRLLHDILYNYLLSMRIFEDIILSYEQMTKENTSTKHMNSRALNNIQQQARDKGTSIGGAVHRRRRTLKRNRHNIKK